MRFGKQYSKLSYPGFTTIRKAGSHLEGESVIVEAPECEFKAWITKVVEIKRADITEELAMADADCSRDDLMKMLDEWYGIGYDNLILISLQKVDMHEQKLRKADNMFNQHKGEWSKIEVRQLRLAYQDAYIEIENEITEWRKLDNDTRQTYEKMLKETKDTLDKMINISKEQGKEIKELRIKLYDKNKEIEDLLEFDKESCNDFNETLEKEDKKNKDLKSKLSSIKGEIDKKLESHKFDGSPCNCELCKFLDWLGRIKKYKEVE